MPVGRGSAKAPRATAAALAGCGGTFSLLLFWLLALTALRLFVGPEMARWWRDAVGDPIFRLIAAVIVRARGDAGYTILVCGLAFATLSWGITLILRKLLNVAAFRFRTVNPGALAVDDAQEQMRQIYSDDLEQIAMHEARVIGPRPRRGRRRDLVVGGAGCLLSLLLMVTVTPFSILISLAIFDGLYRLLGQMEASRSIRESAGSMAAPLGPFLPFSHMAFGIDLTERSAILAFVAAVLAYLNWLLGVMPFARLAWPRGVQRGSVVAFIVGILLLYWLTTGLVLGLIVIGLAFNLMMSVVERIFARLLKLHTLAIWKRVRGRAAVPS